MAAAAGKRTCKAIRRFHDEFASLGSNPTPDHAAEMLGIAQYGEHREDNNVMNALLLGRELADFADERCEMAFAEETEEPKTAEWAMTFYRTQFYWGFEDHSMVSDKRYLNDTSDAAKRVLAYYAPYLTVESDRHDRHIQAEKRAELVELAKMMGFYDPTDGNACVNTTTTDYEALADAYEHMPIHQRRMMEEIERAAQVAFVRGLALVKEDPHADLDEEVEQDIYVYLVQTPIIVREFSKLIMEEFLTPAVVARTVILIRGAA